MAVNVLMYVGVCGGASIFWMSINQPSGMNRAVL